MYKFYATRSDLLAWLTPLEKRLPIKYALQGAFGRFPTPTYVSASAIGGLGVETAKDWQSGRAFLILPRHQELIVDPVPKRDSGTLYYAEFSRNAAGVVLRPGGMYGDACLIRGRIDPCHPHNATARKLYGALTRAMRRAFAGVEDFYVGPQALAMLKSGFRLTDFVGPLYAHDLKP